ncbi:uncharacterized protein [Dermacentor andersoni]|uniref:uncharacterized protein n=1 Tax=Dermacentor andersoni TaxID=34620 RepID=UPI002417EBC0|nr:pecanex-like protein 1 [Dermacentor andersoni]
MDSGGGSCKCGVCDECLERGRDSPSSQQGSTKRPKVEQPMPEEEMDATSDVREGEEVQRDPRVSSSSGSSCSSPSTETTALTLSTEGHQLTSPPEKAASKSATATQAGTHPRLSAATLSSGSVGDYSADDEMSTSSTAAKKVKSLSRRPASRATGALGTSSSKTGAAAAGETEAQRTSSDATSPEGDDDDCFLPPEAPAPRKTKPAQSETNPDQSEATQPPTSQEPPTPMDVGGSDGAQSAETADPVADVSDVCAGSDPIDDSSASEEDPDRDRSTAL